MPFAPQLSILLDSSHLFRAGDKYQTQFFVMDVVNFLKSKFYKNTDNFKTIVLHGSTKSAQSEKYTTALERYGVNVIQMQPIPSITGGDKVYYKPMYYAHKMMGNEIPLGSQVLLVGFHNSRYLPFLERYHSNFKLSMAAFGTSSKMGVMNIPEPFKPLLEHAISLDEYVKEIKAEFKQKKPKLQ